MRAILRLKQNVSKSRSLSFLSQHSYNLITRCWADNPDTRPTFTKLCQDLEDWMQRDTPYLDMDQVDEEQPYYNVSAMSASSRSSGEEHAPESTDVDTTAENPSCGVQEVKL